MKNKLSFIVPCYQAKKHIIRNIKMWKSLCNIVDIHWVEDSKEAEIKNLCAEIGGIYHSKENGNWGSVINFAIENKIIKTEFVAIVDPDDEIDIKELLKLLRHLGDKDIYFTKYVIRDFITRKSNVKSYRFDKYTFIHQVWFKTKLLESLMHLPEKISFTDNLVVNHILSSASTKGNIDAVPYIYYVNFQNQSTSGGLETVEAKINAALKIKEVHSNFLKGKSSLRKRISDSEIMNLDLVLLRAAFDSEKSKENRKKIDKIYKQNKKMIVPIRNLMIWSKMYWLFKGGK